MNENKFIKTNPTCIDVDGNTKHANWYASYAKEHHNYKYQPDITLNTGLFLMDKTIKNDLVLPPTQPEHPHYEQPYLTMLLEKCRWEYSDHPLEFNHIDHAIDSVERLHKSFIPHFSGDFNHREPEKNMERMRMVMKNWEILPSCK